MPEVTETIIPIYGGSTSIDHRADGERQAADYRASQRCADWERMSRAEGKPGSYGFLWWCVGVIAAPWALGALALWLT